MYTQNTTDVLSFIKKKKKLFFNFVKKKEKRTLIQISSFFAFYRIRRVSIWSLQ